MKTPYEIIQELNISNSSIYKKEILEKYKDNFLWLKILKYTYDSNLNYYIKKIPTVSMNEEINNYISFDKAEIDYCQVFTMLDSMSKQEVRGDKGTWYLEEVLFSLNDNDREVVKLILGRDIKCGVNVNSINKVYKSLIPVTNYMGCQQFNAEKIKQHIRDDGFIYSEQKEDGRYCNSVLTSSKELVSRQGKPTLISGKLQDELNLFKVASIFEETALNGELVVPGVSRLASNAIVSRIITINEKIEEQDTKAIKKAKDGLMKDYSLTFEEAQDKMTYCIWDMLPKEDYIKGYYDVTRENRLEYIREIFLHYYFTNIIFKEPKKCFTYEDVLIDLKYKLSLGLEGTVVKSRYGTWNNGKGSKVEQWKGKVEFNCELEIIGYKTGKKGTKYENTLGSLLCKTKNGEIEVAVSGIEEKKKKKDITRDEFWNNQEKYLGSIITIKCNGLSIDSDGKYNFFYPNYVMLRDDKTSADDLDTIKAIEASILELQEEL